MRVHWAKIAQKRRFRESKICLKTCWCRRAGHGFSSLRAPIYHHVMHFCQVPFFFYLQSQKNCYSMVCLDGRLCKRKRLSRAQILACEIIANFPVVIAAIARSRLIIDGRPGEFKRDCSAIIAVSMLSRGGSFSPYKMRGGMDDQWPFHSAISSV